MILNLTQHDATPEQLEAGVVEPDSETKAKIRGLLTFDDLPSKEEIDKRAFILANIADGYASVMIGGAPYLMGALENALRDNRIVPLYAFSERVSVDQVQEDGTVKKVAIFKHKGFVEV